MRSRRVLVYGEMDVHAIDGSSIWLVSTVEVIRRAGCEVVLLLRFPPRSDRLLKSLCGLSGITVIDPAEHPKLPGADELRSQRGLSAEGAVRALEHLAACMAVDAVVVRGSATARRLASSDALRGRLWPYLTDIPQSVFALSAEHRAWLAELASASAVMLCQTEGIRALLEACVRGTAGKCELWPPMVPDSTESASIPAHDIGTRSTPIRLGYMGKFAPRWNTLEMTSLPALLRQRGIHATLDMVGDKVHHPPEHPGWGDAMRCALESADGVTWHGGLPRDEAIRAIATCHLGLSWRSPDLDSSLELSTKFLEYAALALPIAVNRTFGHEELLGCDYPLFVDEGQTVVDVIERAVRRRDDLRTAATRTASAAYKFRMDQSVPRVRKIVERVLPDFESVAQQRRAGSRVPRIAVAGHDLKFMERLAARIEGSGAFELRWDRRRAGQERPSEVSRACVQWADAVICEWCASNAVWYSHHLRPSQGLIVRLHRYELERPWPRQLKHDKVDRLVCVSRHTALQAAALMPELADRIEVIANWVDVEQLDRPKLEGAEFTIGLLGASVPRKGLLRALDVVERVRTQEPRFQLSVKSELPWRMPWWTTRESDRNYFMAALARIAESPLLRGAVTFEDPGGDVASWFRRVGWVLSTSDDESFHLAPAEGAASGAVPVILNWHGAGDVHGSEWVHESPAQAAQWILDRHADGSWIRHGQLSRARVRERYALEDIAVQWGELISEVVGGESVAGPVRVRAQDLHRSPDVRHKGVPIIVRPPVLSPVRVPPQHHVLALNPVSSALWRWSRRADRLVHASIPRRSRSRLCRFLRRVARQTSNLLRPRRRGVVLSDYGVWIRECPDDVTFRMCLLGTYGSFLADLLDRQREPFCFIDGGANLGIFSLIALQNPHCVGVHAYEPDPITLPVLRDNLSRSGRAEWDVHPFALSSAAGPAELTRIPGHSGGSSIIRTGDASAQPVTVRCVDGTHLLDQMGGESAPLILKLDVEGAEHLALAGLLPYLGARIKAVWLEFSPFSHRDASVEMLHGHGFEEVARVGTRRLYDALWLPRGSSAPAPVQ